jgi:hypothetical protein
MNTDVVGLSLCVVTFLGSLVLAADQPVGQQDASTAAEPAASSPVIRTQWEITLEPAIRGEDPAPGTLAFVLVSAANVAEKFGRLDPKAQNGSNLLTEHSRSLPDSAPGKAWLARQQKLHQEHWYRQLVDVYFADDALAMAFAVFVPRPTQKPKVVEAMYLIRQGNQWQVSLDIDAEVTRLLGAKGQHQLAMLRAAGEKRLKELQAVVSRPLDAPLPFRGTWASHFRQSGLFLCFNEAGEATTIVTRGNGTMSYSVCDYHVADSHIVIESQRGPIRLTLRRDQFWEHDGQRYYTLSVEDPRIWFPDAPKEILYLKPVYQSDWPVRRPVQKNTKESEQ